MKKAVVLLITLSVISVLSLIVLSNLDLINNLIQKQKVSKNKTAAVFISEQINKQIFDIVSNKDNKDYIDKLLEEDAVIASIDLTYENNSLIINYLKFHDKTLSLEKDIQSLSPQFFRYLVDNKYISVDKKQNKKTVISNYKQLNYIIANYLSKNEDNVIQEYINNITYKDEIRYTTDDENNNEERKYYECTYTFSHQDTTYTVEIIFNAKEEKIIEYKIWN